jgi:ferritin-like protein
LLYTDWRGYIISGFSLVWIANFYMTIFGLLRQGLKEKKIDANIKETKLEEIKEKEADNR